jgi:hypothetical protein
MSLVLLIDIIDRRACYYGNNRRFAEEVLLLGIVCNPLSSMNLRQFSILLPDLGKIYDCFNIL